MTESAILEPTKDICQALYLQGFGYSQIADKTGVKPNTVRTWINRYGWSVMRDKVSTHLEQRVTTPLLAKSVHSASAKVRECVSKELEQACEQLSKVKQGRTLPKLNARQDVLAKVVQSANKVFGWDQQSSSTVASVQSLSSDLPEPAKPITDTVPVRTLALHNSSDAPAIDTQVPQQASVVQDNPVTLHAQNK